MHKLRKARDQAPLLSCFVGYRRAGKPRRNRHKITHDRLGAHLSELHHAQRLHTLARREMSEKNSSLQIHACKQSTTHLEGRAAKRTGLAYPGLLAEESLLPSK
jgi:hypothetical protein